MTTMQVQRFTNGNPCPVCQGWDGMQRGKGIRCHGFLSSDGEYAHCSREEKAGGLAVEAGGTYAHRLLGNCNCGMSHEFGHPVTHTAQRDGQVNSTINYDYRDADGTLLYQVVRGTPKRFWQRRPDTNGEWAWNLSGVTRVLYRLPDILAADAKRPVYIVEGEKDVDALIALGCLATTNSGGAGKWLGDYSAALRGRHVVILPDNDAPGRDHAEAVARSLLGTARSVRILELPGLPDSGGDVSDWLGAGGSAEELTNLVKHTPVRDARFAARSNAEDRSATTVATVVSPPLKDTWPTAIVRVWERTEPAPRRFLIGKIVPDGCITQFYGDGGQGKSYIALGMAAHVTLGRPFLRMAVERRPALYLDAELDEDEFIRRAYQVARGLGLDRPPKGLHYHKLTGSLADKAVQQAVQAHVERSGAGFLILDSLTIGSFGADMKEADAVTGVMKAMEGWGVPIVAIDHIAKPAFGSNQSQYRAFGSVFKGNVARSAIQIVRAEGGGLTLIHKKTNFGPPASPVHLALDFHENRIVITAIEEGDDRLMGAEENLPTKDRIAVTLAANRDGLTADQIATELSLSPKTVSNQLSILRKAGKAEPAGNGVWHLIRAVDGPGTRLKTDKDMPDPPQDDDDGPIQLAF